MNKEEHIGGTRPITRPHFLGEEITRPERVSMGLEKLVPRHIVLRWLGADARFHEDSSDRGLGNIMHADLGGLTENPPESKAALLCYAHDQLSDLDRLAWRSRSLCWSWYWLFTEPACVCLWLYD